MGLSRIVALLLSGALLAGALLAAAPAADAAKHKGAKHATGERSLEGSLTIELAPPETTLPATQTITLFLPSGIRDAGAKLPSCNPEKLQASGESACPKGSEIGTGEAAGYTLGVVEPIKLLLYNGPGGSLLTYVVGLDPVSIQVVVQGTVSRPAGTYGLELAFTIPQGLLEPLPGDPAWLLSLHATLNGKAGWLRSSNCPPHGWSLGAKLGYTNGQSLMVGGSLACV
jgi:hypothetical protein